ncbi:MAG: hypothetical protein WA970_12115 [Gammaproteobacteria bacterium]
MPTYSTDVHSLSIGPDQPDFAEFRLRPEAIRELEDILETKAVITVDDSGHETVVITVTAKFHFLPRPAISRHFLHEVIADLVSDTVGGNNAALNDRLEEAIQWFEQVTHERFIERFLADRDRTLQDAYGSYLQKMSTLIDATREALDTVVQGLQTHDEKLYKHTSTLGKRIDTLAKVIAARILPYPGGSSSSASAP